MENHADPSGGFQDLLSAALSESGVDFDDFDVGTSATVCDSSLRETGNVTQNDSSINEAQPQNFGEQPVDEVDLFSQALQQLSDTNKKAAEFESKYKSARPVPTRKFATNPEPGGVSSSNVAPGTHTSAVAQLLTSGPRPVHAGARTTQLLNAPLPLSAQSPRLSVNGSRPQVQVQQQKVQFVSRTLPSLGVTNNNGVVTAVTAASLQQQQPIPRTAHIVTRPVTGGAPVIGRVIRTASPRVNLVNTTRALHVGQPQAGVQVRHIHTGLQGQPAVQIQPVQAGVNMQSNLQLRPGMQIRSLQNHPVRMVASNSAPNLLSIAASQSGVPGSLTTNINGANINTPTKGLVTIVKTANGPIRIIRPANIIQNKPRATLIHKVTEGGTTKYIAKVLPKGVVAAGPGTPTSTAGSVVIRPVSTTAGVIGTPRLQLQQQEPAQQRPGTPPVLKIVQAGSRSGVHSPNLVQLVSSVGNISATDSPRVIQTSLIGSNQGVIVRKVTAPGRNSPSSTLTLSTSLSGAALSSPGINNGSIQPQKLRDRDVSKLWANEDISLKTLVTSTLQQNSAMTRPGSPIIPQMVLDEEAMEEEDELGHAETYEEYMPSKLKIGNRHPDSVVETSSLSSVEPSDIWYKLSIPEHVIDYGYLSALQLEAIVYACQKHEHFLPNGERAGFLIGDGAGVGKGRTIAGILYENYLHGRKRALWLSVSNDLKVDAERDLRDIGASKLEVHPLNKFKYAKISSKVNNSVKKGVIFATYSSLIGESQSEGKYRTRFKQLIHWLGKDFDGCIIFDECHRAKNLCPVGSSKPTKTGSTVLELQNRLPKARIIYASATGASEPRNMAYMCRLGLWGPGTPFREFNDFIQAVEKRGVGAMELVAMDMKLRGMYIARQLSFHGVSFKVDEIPVPAGFHETYNEAVKLWVEAREKFQHAANLIDAEHRMRKTMWGQFWSAHQRFFKYFCISAKVKHCVRLARESVKNGKCCVIGLQSTGEARTLEQLEEQGGELNDFVSTAKGVFQTLVEKHFPAPDRRKTLGLFGMGSLFDSPQNSPKPGQKRKMKAKSFNAKRPKEDWSDDSDSDTKESEKSSNKAGDEGESSSDESVLSFSVSSDSESDEDEDNDNPFGNGSDSDDDPWLKKKKKNKKKEKKKDKKKEKKEKEKAKESKKKEKKKKKKKGNESSDEDFDDIDKEFDKAIKAAGMKSVENQLNSSLNKKPQLLPGMDAVDTAVMMKQQLLQKVEVIGDRLPPNTLDELIDELGGPENVAEMTGRKGRVVSTEDGSVQYESRSEVDGPLEILNLLEKQRFMDGEKNIAIISEAASSGISLQADRRALNQRKRVHITLELPWSADRAIQQFGRTHRSNQVSAPEYVFLISELAGEQRFAATVAKRLESLGALTHGDRRATESRDLSRFNIDNKYGRTALEAVMKSVLKLEAPLVAPPENYAGNFFEDCRDALVGVGLITYDERMAYPSLEKDYNNMSKFLNRLLGMPVTLQNHLFLYFTNTLKGVILQAKRNGRWDMGILDLGSGTEYVKKINTKVITGNFSGDKTKTELHTVTVERGMSWTQALDIWQEHAGPDDGFYLTTQDRLGKKTVLLAVTGGGKKREKLYKVYKPNTGQQIRMESVAEIRKKAKKVLPDEAQPYWQDLYVKSATLCTHAYWHGHCRRTSVGMSCEVGLRTRTYYVLSGSVLSVWTKVEEVLASVPGGHASRMQIIRMRTDEGERIVGSLIPMNAVKQLIYVLEQAANTHKTVPRPQYGAPGSENSPRPAPVPQMLMASSGMRPSIPHSASTPTFSTNLSMPMFL